MEWVGFVKKEKGGWGWEEGKRWCGEIENAGNGENSLIGLKKPQITYFPPFPLHLNPSPENTSPISSHNPPLFLFSGLFRVCFGAGFLGLEGWGEMGKEKKVN